MQGTCPADGVMYVATEQRRFLEEVKRSAESLRRAAPGIHVTLFTDRPEWACAAGLFDAVETLPVADSLGTSWGSGLLGKVRALARAPYRRTLFLDSDTRVLSPRVTDLFRYLDDHDLAIAPCEPGESRNQLYSGRPMYNSGVIAFCARAPVRRLLKAWHERQEAHANAIRSRRTHQFEYVRHLGGMDRLYQLVADQTALALFLAPDVNVFGLRVRTLDRRWNWRSDRLPVDGADEVIVHHAAVHKVAPP